MAQIARVKKMVKDFKISLFEVDKYEADDILGALSRQAADKGVDTVIVTGDADTMQLVSPHVKVLYPKAGKAFSDTILFDEAAVREKYGVGPEHIADYKALVGDASDNIPGVTGIGGKTAVKLINEFGSVEDIYKRLDEVEPVKLREKLRDGEPAARRSKELATIVTEMPLALDMDETLVTRFDRSAPPTCSASWSSSASSPACRGRQAPPPRWRSGTPGRSNTASSPAPPTWTSWSGNLLKHLFRLRYRDRRIKTACRAAGRHLSSSEEGRAWYIPVGHVTLDEIQQLPLAQVAGRLKPVFADARIRKFAHNASST